METRSLDDLPLELLETQFVPEFSKADIAHSMQVSSGWFSRFYHADIWKKRIEQDFGIPGEILGLFASEIMKLTGTTHFNFQFLYHQLRHVTKIEDKLPNYLKFSYRDPQYYFQLLTCCYNHAECARKILPPSEDAIWIQLAFYAGFNNISELTDRSINDLQKLYFMYALKAGNLVAAQALFAKYQGQEGFVFDPFFIEWAALSGSLPMVKWVCELGGEKVADAIAADGDSYLYAAGTSGSIDVMQFFVDTFHIEGNEESFAGVLKSGNEDVIAWFSNKFSVPLDASALVDVIHSGKLPLVKRVIDGFGAEPARFDCDMAAQTGDIALYQFLLSLTSAEFLAKKDEYIRKKKSSLLAEFYFQDVECHLINAARSGNPKLVDYCISEFQLDCEKDVFHAAIESGNVLLCEALRKRFRLNTDGISSELIASSGNMAMIFWGALQMQRQALIDLLLGKKPNQGDEVNQEEREKTYAQLRLPLMSFAADALLYPNEYSLNDAAIELLTKMMHYLATQDNCTLVERHAIRLLLQEASEGLAKQRRPQLALQLENLHLQLQDKDDLRPAPRR